MSLYLKIWILDLNISYLIEAMEKERWLLLKKS